MIGGRLRFGIACDACLIKLALYETSDGPRFFDRDPVNPRDSEDRRKGTHLLIGQAMFEVVPFSGASDLTKGTISEKDARKNGGGLRYALHENTCKVLPSEAPETTPTRDLTGKRRRPRLNDG